jgi:hypothetical protein
MIKECGKSYIVTSTEKYVSIELLRQAKFLDFKKIRTDIELKKMPRAI